MNNKVKIILKSAFAVLLLASCNVAASYRGYRVKLQSEAEVYSEFDMSVFRGIISGMSYKEMVKKAGEPHEILEYKDADGDCKDPVYYSPVGKVLIAWDGKYKEIGLVQYIPFRTAKFTLKDFVHDPNKLGISSDMEDFAVYVDDLMYFIVHLDNENITKIDYWLAKEKYFYGHENEVYGDR